MVKGFENDFTKFGYISRWLLTLYLHFSLAELMNQAHFLSFLSKHCLKDCKSLFVNILYMIYIYIYCCLT